MSRPLIYEINTRCWLRELSAGRVQPVHLGNVPDAEFLRWQQLGFTHIWLMGVWTTGPRSRECYMKLPETPRQLQAVLSGWRGEDAAGSPYAIGGYRVPDALGGEAGLAAFRKRLHDVGLRLILDFVPNHVGLDHRWAVERPELFVQSATPVPGAVQVETRHGPRWLAHGKDPYFPAWVDTLQLDHRRADTRVAVIDELRSVASRCDGVRCDMAMLLLNDVFERNWAAYPTDAPRASTEFWSDAIGIAERLDFLFVAEAYWDLEEKLQTLGFDYTYDKRVTDHLVERRPVELSRHLPARGGEFVRHSVHFLENHDEPRIAGRLTPAEHRAAAWLTFSLPGACLLHEGQLAGARIRTPVQLARGPAEAPDAEIVRLYDELLNASRRSFVGSGRGELLQPLPAWPGNPTAENFVVVQWESSPPDASAFDLVAVNLASHQSQCRVQPHLESAAPDCWQVTDLLNESGNTARSGETSVGVLKIDLPAHGVQLWRVKW